METIQKLYKNYGKCDDQQQYKEIIEESIVSTIEGFINSVPMSPRQYVTV